MPLGDELLENFKIRALPQSGRVMSPEEEAAEMERMLTEDGEKDDVTAKVVKIVKADLERGKEANEAESSFRSKNYDAYRAKGDGKAERPGHSRIKCSDIMDTIEWMMPSFIKAFAGTTECISISPNNEEDVQKAEKLEKLLNWQFMGRHCKGFTVMYQWIKSCLIYGTSILKITWQDKYVKKGFDLPIATEAQIYAMQQDSMVKGDTMRYNLAEGRLSAESAGGEGNKRVTAIFTPQQLDKLRDDAGTGPQPATDSTQTEQPKP